MLGHQSLRSAQSAGPFFKVLGVARANGNPSVCAAAPAVHTLHVSDGEQLPHEVGVSSDSAAAGKPGSCVTALKSRADAMPSHSYLCSRKLGDTRGSSSNFSRTSRQNKKQPSNQTHTDQTELNQQRITTIANLSTLPPASMEVRRSPFR